MEMIDDPLKSERGLGYFGDISKVRNPNQKDDELDRVLETAESLGLTTIDSYRGIDETATGLGRSRDEFVASIRGTKICDVGSGYGGLAIECILENITNNVISVNPAIAHPSFKNSQRKILVKELSNRFSKAQIYSAFDVYERNSYSATAEKLPFGDNTFDLVVDNKAVTFYSAKIGPDRYKKSLQEMIRILKPGGQLIIGDGVHFLDESKKSAQLQIIEDLGLKYTFIYGQEESKYKLAIGVIITK